MESEEEEEGKGEGSDSEQEKKLKNKMNEDWQFLKQTLHGEWNNKGASSEMLNFQEKVDMLIEEEEELIGTHMKYIKEAASLLTEEGSLITKV